MYGYACINFTSTFAEPQSKYCRPYSNNCHTTATFRAEAHEGRISKGPIAMMPSTCARRKSLRNVFPEMCSPVAILVASLGASWVRLGSVLGAACPVGCFIISRGDFCFVVCCWISTRKPTSGGQQNRRLRLQNPSIKNKTVTAD